MILSTTRDTFRRENWKEFSNRAGFFFSSKIAVRKIFTSSREDITLRSHDCNLFECHLRSSLQRPMRLNSLRYELLAFRRGRVFFGKFWEKLWILLVLIYKCCYLCCLIIFIHSADLIIWIRFLNENCIESIHRFVYLILISLLRLLISKKFNEFIIVFSPRINSQINLFIILINYRI